MPTNITVLKAFLISSHPYAFDAMFVCAGTIDMRWTGAGQVVFHASGGGVNQIWALVEADDEGCSGLTKAGFNVQRAHKGRYVGCAGESSVVPEDGGPVCRASAVGQNAGETNRIDSTRWTAN